MLRTRWSAIVTAAAVIGGMVVGVPSAHADDDTTPPTIMITSPLEGQQIPIGAAPAPGVDFDCVDDVQVATCDAVIGRMDGQAPPDLAHIGAPLDMDWPGEYFLRVTSTDSAGNTSESTVHFEMVGDGPQDRTGPTIEIAAPVDGAQVKKGAHLTAAYLCQDSGSGVESCDGTVPNGEAVDTSTLGLKEFTVFTSDIAGNESTKTIEYEVIASASVTVSGTIRDASGNAVPESTVEAVLAGTNDVLASTVANSEGVYSLTLPEGTYDLRYRGPAGTGVGANLERNLTEDRDDLDVVLGPFAISVSGVVSDGVGGQANWGWVDVYDQAGTYVAYLSLDSERRVPYRVGAGTLPVQRDRGLFEHQQLPVRHRAAGLLR